MSVIELNNVDLNYPIYNLSRSLRSVILGKGLKVHFVPALKKINLILNKGDRLGLIGNNGCGKTTLLKVIGGIYQPTEGKVTVKEKPLSLFDISMGLNPEATGLENIYIMGYLRGLSKIDIQKRINDIIEFSEIGKFCNLPTHTYSAGMKIRLATAIALNLEPKLLLIDEFFGAGDKDFLEKSRVALIKKIERIDTLIFASHNEELMNSICNRKIRLKNGQIIEDIKI
jgi:ABC-type polysaccharide/polyol phosphate transport system ATPase subunit